MDLAVDETVQWVVIRKNARAGVSEAMRNIVGYWADQDPGPLLYTNATAPKAGEVMSRQFVPMFKKTACLAPLLAKGKVLKSTGEMLLGTHNIDIAFPGSTTSLADRTKQRAISDEVDKWEDQGSEEATPVKLIDVRGDTYRDLWKHFILSSPVTTHHTISRELDACPIVLHLHVPCPHCDTYQIRDWANVKWPEKPENLSRTAWAALVDEEDLAWYQCPHCQGEIRDRHVGTMELRCMYAPATTTDADGKATPFQVTEELIAEHHAWLQEHDEHPPTRPYNFIIWPEHRKTKRVGIQLTGLLSPWLRISQIAGEWIATEDDPKARQNVVNSRLGLPNEESAATIDDADLRPKIEVGGRARVVPTWAAAIIATVDTQDKYFWYDAWAFAPDHTSRLIDAGQLGSFDAVAKFAESTWTTDIAGYPDQPMHITGCDAGGTHAHEVYELALHSGGRIVATRGHGGKKPMDDPRHFVYRTTHYTPPDALDPIEYAYLRIDTHWWKDRLAERLKLSLGRAGAVHLHADVDEDWCRHMRSEHKVMEGKGSSARFVWKPRPEGGRNDHWDCTVYAQCLAAYIRVQDMQTIAQREQLRLAAEQLAAQRPKPKSKPKRW